MHVCDLFDHILHSAWINLDQRWPAVDRWPRRITHCPCAEMLLIGAVEYNLQASKWKSTIFFQICHQNSADLCVPYAWLLRDTKCFMEILSIKQWLMWRIASKKANGGWDCILFAVASFILEWVKTERYGNGLGQWEKALLFNAFSHWPSQFTEWSLQSSSNIFHVILENNTMTHGLFEDTAYYT